MQKLLKPAILERNPSGYSVYIREISILHKRKSGPHCRKTETRALESKIISIHFKWSVTFKSKLLAQIMKDRKHTACNGRLFHVR